MNINLDFLGTDYASMSFIKRLLLFTLFPIVIIPILLTVFIFLLFVWAIMLVYLIVGGEE